MSERLQGESWISSSSKRRQDMLFASALLGPAFAVGSIAATALYVEQPTKPFFKQVRSGQYGQLFSFYKLRTMPATDYDDVGGGHADDRATKIGKVLRTTGIDELPQLLNVLRGEMSMVGPRPLMPDAIDEMRDVLSESEFRDWHGVIDKAKPGFVSPFSNASRSLDPQSDEYLLARAEMDVIWAESATKAIDRAVIISSANLALRRLAVVNQVNPDVYN